MNWGLVILAWYGIASLATVIAFGLDKRRAVKGGRRIPERTLHIMELIGGVPGGLLAMQLFRHKRRKTSYVVVIWAIAVLHAAAWGAVIWMSISAD